MEFPFTPNDTSQPQTCAKLIKPSHTWSRALVVGSLLALIILGLGWELAWAPVGMGRGYLALKILPLSIPLPGLLKYRLYTYRWMSLFIWLYVAEGLIRWAEGFGLEATLASGQVFLGLALFVGCAWHVRARLSYAPK